MGLVLISRLCKCQEWYTDHCW